MEYGPEVGIRDKGPGITRPGPGRDAVLKIVKNGTRDRTRDRKLKKNGTRDASPRDRKFSGTVSRFYADLWYGQLFISNRLE